MEIGLGLDLRLGLTPEDERAVVRHAARLGYASVWTNAGAGTEPFARCVRWSEAAREAGAQMRVGTNVVPLPQWPDLDKLAAVAADTARRTDGAFVLGVGSGRDARLQPVREALSALRAKLAKVDTPVWLAALGPRMLRLAGEAADGVALNWCTADHVAWSRSRVAAGARRAGRQRVVLAEYIRVAVDDDTAAARRALARAVLGYAIAPAYRRHFARMGFDAMLGELERRHDAGASPDDLADACPDELLRAVGYFGPPAGAAAAFRRLAEGLDVAIVRVVPARPGLEPVLLTLEACRPERIQTEAYFDGYHRIPDGADADFIAIERTGIEDLKKTKLD